MQTVYVKPSEGGRVRQPERGNRVMPAIGDLVPRDGYYERLIIGGDVIVCEAPAPAPTIEPALPAPKSPAPPADPDTRR
jgi:hypothetical protein